MNENASRPSPEIHHNIAAHCFEAEIGGERAECVYEDTGGRWVLTHTYVPPAARGLGLAERLVRAALAEARAQGRTIVPACSYVAAFVARHAEFADLVA
jgi:predicted GNAT family acetyltransferase